MPLRAERQQPQMKKKHEMRKSTHTNRPNENATNAQIERKYNEVKALRFIRANLSHRNTSISCSCDARLHTFALAASSTGQFAFQ